MLEIRAVFASMTLVGAAVLAVVAAPPAGAGGSCHGDRGDRRTNAVSTVDACFSPAVARVGVGETVTWSVADGMPHTVSTNGGTWGGDLPVGGTHTALFDKPGVYPYFCHLHLGMIGTIVVGDGGLPTQLASATAKLDDAVATGSNVHPAALLVVVPVAVAAYVVGSRRRKGAAALD